MSASKRLCKPNPCEFPLENFNLVAQWQKVAAEPLWNLEKSHPLDGSCLKAHSQTLTWKSVFGPCSLAGLSGATGLRLLQKCMLGSSGLGVRSSPFGV